MTNPFSLENKTILVTGASSGIGKVTAIAVSEAGAKVIICGRDEARLQDTFDKLAGDGHEMILADFLSDAPEQDICSKIKSPINGIVHSAGIGLIHPFKFSNRGQVQKLMKVNFEIPYAITQQLFKTKMLANGASVLFISSVGGGVLSVPGNSIYGASKAAINGAIQAMAIEVASKKIRINSLMPGIVKTAMTDGSTNLSTEDYKKDEMAYPLGHGMPIDIANAAIYFLSDASKWITATKLIIDGGVSIP